MTIPLLAKSGQGSQVLPLARGLLPGLASSVDDPFLLFGQGLPSSVQIAETTQADGVGCLKDDGDAESSSADDSFNLLFGQGLPSFAQVAETTPAKDTGCHLKDGNDAPMAADVVDIEAGAAGQGAPVPRLTAPLALIAPQADFAQGGPLLAARSETPAQNTLSFPFVPSAPPAMADSAVVTKMAWLTMQTDMLRSQAGKLLAPWLIAGIDPMRSQGGLPEAASAAVVASPSHRARLGAGMANQQPPLTQQGAQMLQAMAMSALGVESDAMRSQRGLPEPVPSAVMASGRATAGGGMMDSQPSLTQQGAQTSQTVSAPAPVAITYPVAREAAQNTAAKLPQSISAYSGQSLISALGERISVQQSQGVENAVVRLDSPLSGSVRIILRHEAGELQVYLLATQHDVVRQLQAISDGLRQELVNRQFTDVAVHIASHRAAAHAGGGDTRQSRGGGESSSAREDSPNRALSEAEEGYDDPNFRRAQRPLILSRD